jgi:uncharacterized coiled-coil protein SlyX
VFSDASSSMAETLGKIKAALEDLQKLPEKVEQGIDRSFQQRRAAIEEALARYRESIESQRKSLDELYTKLRALPVDVAESLGQSSAKSVSLMEESHKSFLGSLKTAVRATVEDQIASLGSLVGQMDLNARTLRERWDAALAAERESFEGAVISALNASIRAVEDQRAKLLALESTLPESLANTFHQLIRETQTATQSLNGAVLQQQASMNHVRDGLADLAALFRTRGDGGSNRPAPSALPPFRDHPPEVPPWRPASPATGGQGPARGQLGFDRASPPPVALPLRPDPGPAPPPSPHLSPNPAGGPSFDAAPGGSSAGLFSRIWSKIHRSRGMAPP